MDTTNDYNDDHIREEYNAGDRAAKRPRLGPEPAVDNRVPAQVPVASGESPVSNHPAVDDGTYAAAGVLLLR